jgi:hypothetical protein
MIEDEKYIMTAPDLDHSSRLKLMVVDLSPEAVEHVKERLLQLSFGMTLFVQDSQSGDPSWMLTAARLSYKVLVNAEHGPNDLLKGYLISFDKTSVYGQPLPMANRNYYDLDLWLTDSIISWQRNQPPAADHV